jgi:hypothetical protein
MSIPGISPVPVGGGEVAVAWPESESIPGMSIPGMSIPGMSPEGVGGGPPAVASPVPESMPGMSIPGIPPASVGVGELAEVSPEPWSIPAMPDIPAMLDELDLDATMANPTTALATASTTAEITIWLVPVLRVIEKVPKIVVSCRGMRKTRWRGSLR